MNPESSADQESNGSPQVEPSAAEANAYAIAFRLIGERESARRVALSVARAFRSREDDPPAAWLPSLALDTVDASLAAADQVDHSGRSEPDDQAGLRDAVRRRIAAATGDERTACALHHLAGHPIGRVAEFMGWSSDHVRELCAPLAPPPGVDYRELGDPLERVRAAPVVRRPRRRIPAWALVLGSVAVIAALALFASSLEGQRPRFADGSTEPGETSGSAGGPTVDEDGAATLAGGGGTFGRTVDPLPSAGCAGTPSPDGTIGQREVSLEGSSSSYRLRVGASADVAPSALVVALPGAGQDAAGFAASTALDASWPGASSIVVEPSDDGGLDPAGGDDAAAVLAMIDDVVVRECVDLHRVHLYGFGSGAHLAAVLACSDPDRFASATMVAGFAMPSPCDLRPAVAAQFLSNSDDAVFLPTGGYGPDSTGPDGEGPDETVEQESIEDVSQQWAVATGAEADVVSSSNDDVLITDWVAGPTVVVRSVLNPGGGHTIGSGDTMRFVAFAQDHARS